MASVKPDPRRSVRAYRPEDVDALRRLADPELERSTYRSGPRSAIDGVVSGTDPDARCLVAVDSHDAVVGFVIHGTIAGSEGAGRVQLLVTAPAVRRTGIARRLVEAATRELQAAGARFVVIEIPDDPALVHARSLFEAVGFQVDARVRDFYRDGVDLAVLRRDIGG